MIFFQDFKIFRTKNNTFCFHLQVDMTELFFKTYFNSKYATVAFHNFITPPSRPDPFLSHHYVGGMLSLSRHKSPMILLSFQSALAAL